MIPVVIVTSGKRIKLEEQTLRSLRENTLLPYKLFTEEDGRGAVECVATRNKLIDSIPFEWGFVVCCDDDIYLNKNWLVIAHKALGDNPDVSIISGTGWKFHKELVRRNEITITDKMCGGCLFIRRRVWDKHGPFDVDRDKTNKFRERVQGAGGKVARFNDPTLAIHCGIVGVSGKVRSKENENQMQKLADRIGAITNA